MHVTDIGRSTLPLDMGRKTVRLDRETTTMNRLSIRLILFIIVLSALHISAIEPSRPRVSVGTR
jgi:hypothetical protein